MTAPGVGLRNSPNTNSAERNAATGVYRLAVAPAINATLSAAGALGPLGNAGRYAALTFLSSGSAASGFADTTVGEQTKR